MLARAVVLRLVRGLVAVVVAKTHPQTTATARPAAHLAM
jgi:hypothetical protein